MYTTLHTHLRMCTYIYTSVGTCDDFRLLASVKPHPGLPSTLFAMSVRQVCMCVYVCIYIHAYIHTCAYLCLDT